MLDREVKWEMVQTISIFLEQGLHGRNCLQCVGHTCKQIGILFTWTESSFNDDCNVDSLIYWIICKLKKTDRSSAALMIMRASTSSTPRIELCVKQSVFNNARYRRSALYDYVKTNPKRAECWDSSTRQECIVIYKCSFQNFLHFHWDFQSANSR